MTTDTYFPSPRADRPSPVTPARRPLWRFLLGSLELVAVATVSMFLVDQVTSAVLAALGLTSILLTPEGVAAVMSVDVLAGTVLWLLHRRRSTRSVVAVVLAVVVGFAAPLAPYWGGLVSATEAVLLGHLLVVPALAVTVGWRLGELGPGGARSAAPPVGGVRRVLERIADRWPSVLALLLTFGKLLEPSVVPAVVLVLLGAEYLIIGAARRQFRDRRLLLLHIAGAVAYALLAGLAVVADPTVGALLIAAGWLLHAGWDIALHRANVVTWRWYAEACAVFDVVIALTVLAAVVA